MTTSVNIPSVVAAKPFGPGFMEIHFLPSGSVLIFCISAYNQGLRYPVKVTGLPVLNSGTILESIDASSVSRRSLKGLGFAAISAFVARAWAAFVSDCAIINWVRVASKAFSAFSSRVVRCNSLTELRVFDSCRANNVAIAARRPSAVPQMASQPIQN